MIRTCLLLLCAALFGCSDASPERYTVTDHAGRCHGGLVSEGGGWGWAAYRDKDGKLHVFTEPYTAIQE